jgi:chromosome partitioning protein
VRIWAVVNQKGGVGKTTTAVNLAGGLAFKGQRTLLVDGDPQGNATTGVGVNKKSLKFTLFDVLLHAADKPYDTKILRDTLIKVNPYLDVLPATLDLAGIETTLIKSFRKEQVLSEVLSGVRKDYDWVIIDAPPSLGLLTINILASAEGIVVPMQCEFYALEGLSQLIKTVDVVRKKLNPKLKIAKVLFTMYDPRNRLTQQVTHEVNSFFGNKVSTTAIPKNVRLGEAPSFGEPAITLFPSSKGAQAYLKFVEEVLEECAVQ